ATLVEEIKAIQQYLVVCRHHILRRLLDMFYPCTTRSCLLETSRHPHTRETHVVTAREFVVISETLTIETGEAPHFIDITESRQEIIECNGLIMGSAL